MASPSNKPTDFNRKRIFKIETVGAGTNIGTSALIKLMRKHITQQSTACVSKLRRPDCHACKQNVDAFRPEPTPCKRDEMKKVKVTLLFYCVLCLTIKSNMFYCFSVPHASVPDIDRRGGELRRAAAANEDRQRCAAVGVGTCCRRRRREAASSSRR